MRWRAPVSAMTARFGRCQQATAAVEFALICLPLLMLCIGTLEFGRALHTRNSIAYAADVAVRSWMLESSSDEAVLEQIVEQKVREAFTGGPANDLVVTFPSDSVDGHEFRTLSVSYPLTLLIPALDNTSLMLSVQRRIPK